MSEIGMMNIHIKEHKYAMRINGVTVSKFHLAASFAESQSAKEAVYKYLTLVPFLAEKVEVMAERLKGPSKYLTLKAKRIYDAIGLNNNNCVPFMLVCLEKAGDLPQGEGAKLARKFGLEMIEGTSEDEILSKLESVRHELVGDLDKATVTAAMNQIFHNFNKTVGTDGKKPTIH